MWSSTRSELILAFRAARTKSEREHDMAVFVAWRMATLMKAKKIPVLTRLLRKVKRIPAAERAQIRSDIAAADAEFARLEAAARAKKEASADG